MANAKLINAPYGTNLRIDNIEGLTDDEQVVLGQLGLCPQESIEKLRAAPLGDPISIRIGGGSTITLRREVCEKINVCWEF